MKFILFLCFFIVVAGFGAGAGWVYLTSQTGSSVDQEILFQVQAGDNFPRVARRLQKKGLIRSERVLRWYAKITGLAGTLKLGEYSLRPNMPLHELVDVLISGKSVTHKITIPEGKNKFEIGTLIAQHKLGSRKKFLELVDSAKFIRSLRLPTSKEGGKAPHSLEGYLYPDTYQVSKIMDEAAIIRLMVRRFREIFAREIQPVFDRYKGQNGVRLTPHEVIILASVVEKETGAGFERPMIASVFYNRLKLGKRLESDPTTIYGMWDRDKKFGGNLRRVDLRTFTPYNTYSIKRLPAGPIANPGLSAIRAVLAPKVTKYLFFVSRNDGTHVFTTNYKDHLAAVNFLQKNPMMRRGRSWRDLPAELRATNPENKL